MGLRKQAAPNVIDLSKHFESDLSWAGSKRAEPCRAMVSLSAQKNSLKHAAEHCATRPACRIRSDKNNSNKAYKTINKLIAHKEEEQQQQ